MTYAQVTANEITTISGRLPAAARRLDSRAWVLGFPSASTVLQEACGWHPVVDAAKPADTDTTTHDRSIELVDGTPTVVWTARPWTADEIAARTAARNALTGNRDFIADTAITNAKVVAQVKALTRQNQALIRLTLNDLDGTD